MGYAIVTRDEPRPVESLVYNVYNLVLVFLLLVVSRRLRYKATTSVDTEPDALRVNDKDFSQLFGAKKTRLVNAFASAEDRRLCCPDIQRILRQDDGKKDDACERCRDGAMKATLCVRYRTTYNLVLDLKKNLESIEVGTITSNGNRRNILAEGWKLVLFENVRISVKKKPSTD